MKEHEFAAENEIFPLRLRELMTEHGTTQEQLAQHLGIRRQTLSLYVNGQSKADWMQVVRIAQYYNVPADWLLGLSDVKSKDMTAQAVEALTGLSEQTLNILIAQKENTSYIRGLNFLIEEKNMLQKLIRYLWSDFYSQLSLGDFQYVPKRQDVLDYMEDIQFASVVQTLPSFKKNAYHAHKDNNAVVSDVLWESLIEFADREQCEQIIRDNVAGLEGVTADEAYDIEQEYAEIPTAPSEELLTPEEAEMQAYYQAEQEKIATQFVMVHRLLERFAKDGDETIGK